MRCPLFFQRENEKEGNFITELNMTFSSEGFKHKAIETIKGKNIL
jgi:hypothetical protein